MKDISEFEVLPPQDIFECARFDITDALLDQAKIVAYMYDNQVKNDRDEEKPYNQKSFPEKAIDIIIQPKDGFIIEIYFLSDKMAWDSKFLHEERLCKLGPDQMEQFCRSQFYEKMLSSLSRRWPLTDPTFRQMYDGVAKRQMLVGWYDAQKDLDEDDVWSDRVNQVGKRKDLANKDLTGDGERDYTSTGRKIITFGDNGVRANSGKYYCWPNPKFPFKWSQWKDWTKIKPLCKMSFEYNKRTYGISLSLFDENFQNRGFRGYDADWRPPLGWLTPGECAEVMQLNIVQKFTRQCIKNMKQYLDMSAEEIYEKINNKDKISLDEIRKTKRIIKHVVDVALKRHQADTYCFT